MPKERKQQPAKKLAKKPEKEPIEMTSDELLDAVIDRKSVV